MPSARTTQLTSFMLTLDGVACGFLASSVGGDISADVIEERADGSPFAHKHIGRPKYEDLTLQLGFGMASPVYDWIAATWSAGFARKNGSVTAVDASMNAFSEQQFARALLTKTTIPALDAASKDAGRLTITLSPESTTTAAGAGKAPTVGIAQHKPFLLSRFRLELDGLDCSHVTKIDSFTVEVKVSSDAVGGLREVGTEPTGIAFPDLRVTMAEGAAAATWQSWFTDFVLDGKNEEAQEKNGSIVFLAPDLQGELARATLHNVGISALRRVPFGANDSVRRLAADLYCERMEFAVGTAPPSPVKIVDPTPNKVPVPPRKIIGGIPR
jgi:phage tail-like protein